MTPVYSADAIAIALDKWREIYHADCNNPAIEVHRRELCYVASALLQGISATGTTSLDAFANLQDQLTSNACESQSNGTVI